MKNQNYEEYPEKFCFVVNDMEEHMMAERNTNDAIYNCMSLLGVDHFESLSDTQNYEKSKTLYIPSKKDDLFSQQIAKLQTFVSSKHHKREETRSSFEKSKMTGLVWTSTVVLLLLIGTLLGGLEPFAKLEPFCLEPFWLEPFCLEPLWLEPFCWAAFL